MGSVYAKETQPYSCQSQIQVLDLDSQVRGLDTEIGTGGERVGPLKWKQPVVGGDLQGDEKC